MQNQAGFFLLIPCPFVEELTTPLFPLPCIPRQNKVVETQSARAHPSRALLISKINFGKTETYTPIAAAMAFYLSIVHASSTILHPSWVIAYEV